MTAQLHRTVAPHVAEKIARAQDMLGRLGERQAYEPNYAGEKLADAARCCIEALALIGEDAAGIDRLSSNAWEQGHRHREALETGLRTLEEAAGGLRCVRCLERGGAMTPAGTVAGAPDRQVFEHPQCRADALAPQIDVEVTDA